MDRATGTAALLLLLASGAGAQDVPPPPADDAARVNAEAAARVSAQSVSIRQSQEDYARAQAAFAQVQAAYEAAKRQNDADRAAAADSAVAYQRELAGWKATVAEIKARNEKRAIPSPAAKEEVTVVARSPGRTICTVEANTGSIIPRRTCRSPAEVREMRKAGEAQVQAIRDDMSGGTSCTPGVNC